MKLCIYGVGGFGKEVYDIASRINNKHQRWEEILFVVDSEFIKSDSYKGRLLAIEDISNELDLNNLEVIIANGEPMVRKQIYAKVKAMKIKLTTLIDPSAIISDTATLGEGVIVAPFSHVTSSTVLGNNVVVNAHTIIGHDITIGEHSVISTNVSIGGSSVIGAESYIGLGAQTKDRLSIGEQVIVSMGAIVFKDIPDKMIAMGNPARPLRRNEESKVFK
jgi:sugar O-acyltransferase (sialic acid O-acetyltransferase NeuD family)